MDFAQAQHLVWLWLLPLAAAALVFGDRRRRARLKAFFGDAPTRAAGGGRGLWLVQGAMLLGALALVVVALARPRWGYDWQDVKRRGVDIVVAVDLSASMLATDVDPTRLERAKREIADLLGILRGDRLGLVAFAGQAFVQCPLTEDYAAVRMFMSFLDTRLIPTPGTNVGAAIRQAMRALRDGGADQTQGQAIIVITDGEDTYGEGVRAAEEAKAAGVKVYTVGVGSEGGAPIPEAGGGFKKDRDGNVVLTKPDENGLQEIALATGGMFVRSVSGDMDLEQIYAKGIKSDVAERDYEETRRKLWKERFQWFLGAALALLVAEFWLRQRGALVLLAALAAFGAGGEARATGSKAAHDAFAKGDYGSAAQTFGNEARENPDDARVVYNQAASLYKAGKYKEAVEAFARAGEAAKAQQDAELEGRAAFGRANALVGTGGLDDAIKAYEELLAKNGESKAAQENLEYVKKLKEQQQQQRQKQQQDEKKDEQKKEGEDKSEPKEPQKDESQSGESEKNEQKDEEQQQQQQPSDQGQEKQQEQQPGGGETKSEPQPAEQAGAPRPQPQPTGTLDKEQAEQVLRGAEDQAGKYLLVPPRERQKHAPPPHGKDW